MRWLFLSTVLGRIGIWNVGSCGGGGGESGKREDLAENPWSKDENQQQTQPTFDNGSWNRTWPQWWKASALTTA